MSEDVVVEEGSGGVLVVDGNAEAGGGVADALGDGVAVETGVDAAFERVLTERPRAVVAAQSLADGTGLDLLRAVRAESAVPFVLYAADGDETLASEATTAGVTEYVPVEADEAGDLGESSLDSVRAATERAVSGADPPFEALVEDGPVGTCGLADGRIVHANGAFGDLFGSSPDELAGTEFLELIAEGERDRVAEAIATDSPVGDREPRRVAVTGVRADGGRVDVELHAVAASQRGVDVVASALDVGRRRGRERQLSVLHETTREMMRTDDREAIAETAVDTAVEVLDSFSVAIYLYDREAGSLTQAASASGMIDLPAGISPLDEHVEFAWEVFVQGDERLETDFQARDESAGPLRSGLAIPLGDHGVFVAGASAVDAFDEDDRRFARTLATNTEVALDRAARESTVIERTDRLREQNEQLDRLRRIDAVVRDIGRLLVSARSREEVERAVCERLAQVRYWELAWIGEREVTGRGVTPRAWATASSAIDGDGYLDAVRAAGDDAGFVDTPAERALAEGSAVVTDDVVASHDDEGWRTVTLDHGFRSVASIPLEHEHRTYGVLEVYGDRPDAFGGEEREVLTELADMIAYSLNAIERERALVADAGPELEVRIGDPDEFFARLATETDARVGVEGVVPGDDGTYLTYVSVSDGDPEALVETVTDLADRSAAVRTVRSIDPEAGRFEVRLTDSELFESVTTHGATVREVIAEGDGITLRIGLPGTADVRGFVEAFGRAYPDLDVLAQRSSVGDDPDDLGGDPTEDLTDRQREVLEVAYHSGFFEWPRESTGEDIADTLDVSPPTVHKHLRTAERKLLSAILGARRTETGRLRSAEQ